MNDIREFDEKGFPVWKRNNNQNADYWRNVVGQCVYWHRQKFPSDKRTDKKLMNAYHSLFKSVVLKPILTSKSTSELNELQFMEYVAECYLYLSSKLIDIYEFGEM